jgi:hypothetical protein
LEQPRCTCHGQKSPRVCTHGMDFQTAARQRGSPLSKTSSHVYTRDGFSGTRPTSRGSEGSPLSENTSRVYTRDAVSCTGRLPSASDRPRSELRRPRRRISELRMGRAAHLPGKQSLRVCRSLDSLLGVLPYGELYRGVDTSAIVPLAANSRCVHFRLASAAVRRFGIALPQLAIHYFCNHGSRLPK